MKEPAPKPPEDVALLCGPTDDRKGVRVLRARKGQIEAGEVRPMREGQPLMGGELVRLTPRTDTPLVCDIEVDYAPPPARGADGPAQVATTSYRSGWDRVFQHRPEPAAAKRRLH